MKVLDVEVIRIEGWWKVRLMVRPQVWSLVAQYRRKRDAVTVGRFYAKLRALDLPPGDSVELVIKNYWGRIQEKNTYGYDSPKIIG